MLFLVPFNVFAESLLDFNYVSVLMKSKDEMPVLAYHGVLSCLRNWELFFENEKAAGRKGLEILPLTEKYEIFIEFGDAHWPRYSYLLANAGKVSGSFGGEREMNLIEKMEFEK